MIPVNLLEKVAFLPDRPASQLVHDSDDMRVVVFGLEPGQVVSAHVSPSSVLMTVVEGSGTFLVKEGVREVKAGDVTICAPNEPHGMTAGNERMVILAVIAPSPM